LVTGQKAPRQTRHVQQIGQQPEAAVATRGRRWLLFVHQLPSSPSNIRVRTWRRLQQIGAIVVKQAVYLLPDSANAREDFEWLKAEIEAAGGQATVFAADNVDTWSDDALVEEFRRLRQADYTRLARDIRQVLGRSSSRRARRWTPASQKLTPSFRQRLAVLERIDFFGSAGRDQVLAVLDELDRRFMPHGAPAARTGVRRDTPLKTYRQRLWVTRPRPGVDRMASAWLIGRFIDPDARFGFVADREAAPRDAIPFDMFGVEYTHHGERCTFETLCDAFGVQNAAVTRLATIVHDLDLNDARFGPPEAPAIGAVIEGLQLSQADDTALLAEGMTLFEALYRAFEQSARRVGPRPVARSRPARRRPRKSSR
jgi:hypothetical protein